MMGAAAEADEEAEALKSQASTLQKEIEFLRTLQLVAQGQGKFIPEECPELELQRGPAARIVDCEDTTSELELQRGPAARIVDCADTTSGELELLGGPAARIVDREDAAMEQRRALDEASHSLGHDSAALTETETMLPSCQKPQTRLPTSAEEEHLTEPVGAAGDSKAMKQSRQRGSAVSAASEAAKMQSAAATSETAKMQSAAVGSAVSSKTLPSTPSAKREVLMPWEKSKWLAVGARPAMKTTAQGSLRQVAGLTRLTGTSACVSLSSARSLPTWLRDSEAGEHDAEPKMQASPSSGGSVSSLASAVASPQRRAQVERGPGLTRQRNSNALQQRRSVAGSGGGASTPSTFRARRRHSDAILRNGVASAPLIAH